MFESIIPEIEKHDSIVIFGHANPDGDCYGSQIALRTIIKTQYPQKDVFAVGSGCPAFFALIGEMDKVSLETIQNSLAVVLDSNDLGRLEDKRSKEAKCFIKIDHHIDTFHFNEGPAVIDPKATSTCELVYRLAKEANWKINEIAANALYLGVFTDSARFQYSDNYANTFAIAGDLCLLGAKPHGIVTILNTSQEKALTIRQFIYSHFVKDDGVIYVKATKKERDEIAVTTQQIVSCTGLISHIKGYPMWFVAVENDQGGMQVEMRSEGIYEIDVQKIAAYFGGGGHKYAAGFTVKKFSEDAIDVLLDICHKAIKESREQRCGKNN